MHIQVTLLPQTTDYQWFSASWKPLEGAGGHAEGNCDCESQNQQAFADPPSSNSEKKQWLPGMLQLKGCLCAVADTRTFTSRQVSALTLVLVFRPVDTIACKIAALGAVPPAGVRYLETYRQFSDHSRWSKGQSILSLVPRPFKRRRRKGLERGQSILCYSYSVRKTAV